MRAGTTNEGLSTTDWVARRVIEVGGDVSVRELLYQGTKDGHTVEDILHGIKDATNEGLIRASHYEAFGFSASGPSV